MSSIAMECILEIVAVCWSPSVPDSGAARHPSGSYDSDDSPIIGRHVFAYGSITQIIRVSPAISFPPTVETIQLKQRSSAIDEGAKRMSVHM